MIDNLDEKLFKKSINYLIDGYIINFGHVKIRYCKKGDIIDCDEDNSIETLDKGLFQEYTMGTLTMDKRWLKVGELDDIRYFYRHMNTEQKSLLFTTLCLTMAINDSKQVKDRK